MKNHGRLDLGQSLVFMERKDRDGNNRRQESVNCKRLVSEYPADIHKQGSAKVANDNLNRVQPIGYGGFVAALAERVRQISVDGFSFDVFHEPEDGNDAHCHIEMLYAGQQYQKNKAKVIKDRLFGVFGEVVSP